MNSEKERQMRQHIAQWQQSGQTKKDYCKYHNLGYSQFKNWCDKFGHVKKRKTKPESDFISLPSDFSSLSKSSGSIEIIYPNSVRLQISPDTPLPVLRALIRMF